LKAVVVIPTYNEAPNLERFVKTLFALGIDGLGVLVVDDNSPDGTGAIGDRLAQEYPAGVDVIHRPAKMGLGNAYLAGFAKALEDGADFVFEMDADFSHPPEAVRDLLAAAGEFDVAVGSRYAPGGSVDPAWSATRKLLSWGGNVYARLVTGLRVRDATAGFKCFRRETLAGLDLNKVRSDGYAFQVEMAYACQKKGYRVREVPIVFRDRAHGRSKMSMHIVWEALWRVWQIKWRY
jgi:dolichol-phosphate mannosyltransferase